MAPKKNRKKDKSNKTSEKCWYYNRGYCWSEDQCDERHPDKVCSNTDCFEDKCELRHPNPCKFGPRCTFERKKICLYAHATENHTDKKYDDLDKKVQTLQNENEKLKKNYNDIMIKNEK